MCRGCGIIEIVGDVNKLRRLTAGSSRSRLQTGTCTAGSVVAFTPIAEDRRTGTPSSRRRGGLLPIPSPQPVHLLHQQEHHERDDEEPDHVVDHLP
jgi:hypothetical protein